MDTLLSDLRFALRTLRKSPLVTTVAVICLALGIGVNTTIFSVVNSIAIRPLPYTDAERLVSIGERQARTGFRSGVSYLDFRDFQEQNRSLAQLGGLSRRSLAITDGDEPERLDGSAISANLFPMLGILPMIGRGIRAEEDQPGAERVVLLSEELWQRRYRGDRTIIGRSIKVNDIPHTVIGVMPPKFKFPEDHQLWVALAPLVHTDPRTFRSLEVYARLRPGSDVAMANRELDGLSARLAASLPNGDDGWRAEVQSLRDAFVPSDVRLIIFTMMGAVTFVLLIACANVANIMLARATARGREIAIRAALGAGKGRIVRQLLTESVLVALAAGVLGIPLAYLGTWMLDGAVPREDGVPYYIDWSIDGNVLVYTVAISVITGVIFGLVPALQAAKTNLQETLREGGRGASAGGAKQRLRAAFVVGEVALSLILLVGASLFVRSFLALQSADAGFQTQSIMTTRFYLPGTRYDSINARRQRVEDIVRRVEALPGVQAAGVSLTVPLDGGSSGDGIIIDGKPTQAGEEPNVAWTGVTSHWFNTLGATIAAGRSFTEGEAADSSRVAVIDRTMARRFWESGNAVGGRFRFASDTTRQWYTVIGVIENLVTDDIDSRPERRRPTAYLPYAFLPVRGNGLIVRVAQGSDPASITAALRREIKASDASVPLYAVRTMDDVRALGFWQVGLFGWMFSIFGVIALLLAAIGVYGVIAYGVSQRTQEIGVRVALGAQRTDVLFLIVGQGTRLAGIGVAIGLAGAFAITRIIQSEIFVSATDPLSFIGVAGFLVAIAVVASYLPARRATSVDPLVALRAD
jgi:putative ABC transport system permease protein